MELIISLLLATLTVYGVLFHLSYIKERELSKKYLDLAIEGNKGWGDAINAAQDILNTNKELIDKDKEIIAWSAKVLDNSAQIIRNYNEPDKY